MLSQKSRFRIFLMRHAPGRSSNRVFWLLRIQWRPSAERLHRSFYPALKCPDVTGTPTIMLETPSESRGTCTCVLYYLATNIWCLCATVRQQALTPHLILIHSTQLLQEIFNTILSLALQLEALRRRSKRCPNNGKPDTPAPKKLRKTLASYGWIFC